MPIQKISGGFRFGKHGKIYRGVGARAKAVKQGAAISISRAAGHSIKVKASSRARGYEKRV